MIQRGLVLIVSFFLLGIILESCCSEKHRFFKRDSIVVEHATSITDSTYNQYPEKWSLKSITIDSTNKYAFRFFFEKTYFASNTLNYFNSCYAKCLSDGYKGPNLKAVDFILTSSNNFNKDYPAGTNLFPLLIDRSNKAIKLKYITDRSNSPIDSYIDLMLGEKPTLDSIHKFTISIVEENNNILELTTPAVTFN